MGLDENKAFIHKYMKKVWEAGDLAYADQVLAEEYIDYTTPPGIAPDRLGHRQSISAFHTAFSDVQFTLEDFIAEADKVVVRWTMQARNSGPFFGLPPSGKQCTLAGTDIYQVANDKIIAAWHREDLLGLQRQLQGI